MKESQVKEHVEKGWIRAIVTFELVGKPASHIEEALTQYLDNIKKDHRIIVLREEREPPAEMDEGMYSAFAEEEMLFKDLETITWLSINFSPASVEILAPDELAIPARDLTNWLNDLLAHLHEVNTNVRGTRQATDHMTVAINQLVQNMIVLALKQCPKSAEAISQETGIYSEQLEQFLAHMVENGALIKNDTLYSYVPPGATLLKQQTMTIQQTKILKKKKR